MNRVLVVLLIAAAAFAAYRFNAPASAPARALTPDAVRTGGESHVLDASDRTAETEAFTCQGKTRCSEMTSCAEAKFYLQHCPGTQIDGDRDGMPCESQWCNGAE
jgi:hypothetical protein